MARALAEDRGELSALAAAALLPTEPTGSLLEQAFRLIHQAGPLMLSFEDLSGVTFDLPDLRLAARHHVHHCDYCMRAKADAATHLHCMRNKLAVVRQQIRRPGGRLGVCHAGLAEMVEPWVVEGRVLGIFFYGGFVEIGRETFARDRLRRYCRRHDLAEADWLEAWERLPRLTAVQVRRLRERLRWVMTLASRLLQAQGVPSTHYRGPPQVTAFRPRVALPPLVATAAALAQDRFAEPLRLKTVAAELGCSREYLGRAFRDALGCAFADYLAGVRMQRARHLLATSTLSVGEIAATVGMPEPSQFSRVFRRLEGRSPRDFQRARARGPAA